MTRATTLLLIAASCGLATDRFQITLRLPPGGLYAGEEMQIEFRVEDTTRPDPLGGYAGVVRLAPEAAIDMPAMAGMPKFFEVAHPEGTPGEYGIHPTFAHGGEYRLRLSVDPPSGGRFEREFTLAVQDADGKRKAAPPRYALELTAEPKRPKAGEPVEVRLIVRDHDSNSAVASFETVHEAPMHLVVVRKDLTRYAHEHPALTGSEFRWRYTFPAGGDYRLFADVAPRGAGGQILMAKLKVAGPERGDDAPQPPADCLLEMLSGGEVPARKTLPLEFRLKDSRTGTAPAGLEPYLGAPAHLILIHEDAESFVHSHPVGEITPDGQLGFLARLPKPGVYRGWLQFQRNGKVLTIPLQVRARE